MGLVYTIVAIGAILIGIVRKRMIDNQDMSRAFSWRRNYNVTWPELALSIAVIMIVVMPLVGWAGTAMSRDSQLRYEEFYNGVETDAIAYVRDCHAGRSGSSRSSGQSNCHHTYVCGSYSWTETEYYTDADGNRQSRLVSYSANIYCPYLTQELTFEIHDSLPDGERKLSGVYANEDPVPWDTSIAIPANIPRGAPAEWVEARQRLEADDPRPVTRIYAYDNFILASAEESFLAFSADIDRYLEQGILPEHTQGIMDDPLYGPTKSRARKVQFVGVTPPGGEERWQEALNGLNGALGMTRQGDVHMVIINDALVDSKVRYVQALKAYWTSEAFDRRALAKNAIIIVVGVSGNEVVWAEAQTGMPYGNEVMLRAISRRFSGTNQPLTPEAVIGNPRLVPIRADGEVTDYELRLAEQPGVIESIIFDDFPFVRASMGCTDEDDGENCLGFSHLVEKIEPGGVARTVMVLVALIVTGLMFYLAEMVDMFGLFKARKWQPRYTRN